MRRHYLAAIGASNYKDITYTYKNKRIKTPFIQEALIKVFMPDPGDDDKISIITTKGANKNFNLLKERFSGTKYYDKIKKVKIPDGKDPEELLDIFEKIMGSIRKNDVLIIDVTHGFRTIPMQMLSVVCFASTVKKATITGIYYGALEAGQKGTDGRSITEAPVFDITSFYDIIQWTQAANVFVKYGVSDMAQTVFAERDGKSDSYKTVMDDFKSLTDSLEVSRGKFENEDDESAQAAYLKLKKDYIDHMREKGSPKDELVTFMYEELKDFDINAELIKDNLEFGLATIRWARRYGRTQQGFTALEETMKTYLCLKMKYDPKSRTKREDIVKSACSALAKIIEDKKDGKTREETVEKALLSWAKYNELVSGECETYDDLCSTLTKKDLKTMKKVKDVMDYVPFSYVNLLHRVGQKRNSLNHFGFKNEKGMSKTELGKDLDKYYKSFVRLMINMDKDEQNQ